MKRILMAGLITFVMAVAQVSSAGGIPVIDGSNLAQSIIQVQHMVSQLEHLKNQLETAKEELNSISGVRGLANVIDSVYDIDVNVDVDEILKNGGIKDATTLGLNGKAASVYTNSTQNTAKWVGQSTKSLEQAQKRFLELTGLIAKVNASPDQKDILDLQARIGSEEVMLQNELIKLTLQQSQAQANQALNNQKIRQMAIESVGELPNITW